MERQRSFGSGSPRLDVRVLACRGTSPFHSLAGGHQTEDCRGWVSTRPSSESRDEVKKLEETGDQSNSHQGGSTALPRSSSHVPGGAPQFEDEADQKVKAERKEDESVNIDSSMQCWGLNLGR